MVLEELCFSDYVCMNKLDVEINISRKKIKIECELENIKESELLRHFTVEPVFYVNRSWQQ